MTAEGASREADRTTVELSIDRAAHRLLADASDRGIRAGLIEFLVFGAKQAWACIFGAALLAVIVAARLWYPDDAALARNDALTIAAVLIQVLMVATRLESGRELWVVVLFHLTGTVMELFKTDVGSWTYDGDGVLRVAGVPLFSGFSTPPSAPTWCACTASSTWASLGTRADGSPSSSPPRSTPTSSRTTT